MKKIFFFTIFLVLLMVIPLISSETFEQSQPIDIKKSCTNSSGSICSSSALCNLTIKYPRSNTYVVDSGVMSNNNKGIFNYTLNTTLTGVLGKYNWDMFCCDGNTCDEGHGNYQVTKTGVELTQDKAIIYLGMMVLLSCIFLLSTAGIFLIPAKNNTDDDGYFVGISKLKYLRPVFFILSWALLLAIMFTASNISYLYLETTMMGDLLFNFYTIMFTLTLPMFFFWFIYIFVSIFRDNEMKKMLERGVDIKSSQ